MQIRRGDADIGVTGRIADLGQCSPPRQRMANERVSPVVDRQHGQSGQAEYFAGRQKSAAERMTGEDDGRAARTWGNKEQVVGTGFLIRETYFLRREVRQRPRVPPQRHDAGLWRRPCESAGEVESRRCGHHRFEDVQFRWPAGRSRQRDGTGSNLRGLASSVLPAVSDRPTRSAVPGESGLSSDRRWGSGAGSWRGSEGLGLVKDLPLSSARFQSE